MLLDSPTHDDFLCLAKNLRWSWLREVEALVGEEGLAVWAERAYGVFYKNKDSSIFIADKDGRPVVVLCFVCSGHTCSTLLAGTDAVCDHAREFAICAMRVQRGLIKRGIRRFTAMCLDGPDSLFSWLIKLGYELEGSHRGVGIHGETFLTFGKVV